MSFVPAFLTLNRGMFLGLALALVYVAIRLVMRGNGKALLGLLGLVALVAVAFATLPVAERLSHRVQASSSTADRANLYQETIQRTLESPVFGYGGPRPSETKGAPSVGTQGQVWMVMFSHGLPGVALFMGWLVWAYVRSIRERDPTGMALNTVLLVVIAESLYYGIMTTGLAVAMIAAALTLRPPVAPSRSREELTDRSGQPDASPSVSVVIATCGRPESLRAAVRAALGQEYAGDIEVIVVYDRVAVDPLDDIVVPAGRRALRTVANSRTPGLAGGRNTGILAASGELTSFCDDDDEWLPGKLARQVGAWEEDPSSVLAATGIRIVTSGQSHERLPPERTEFAALLASRITEIHPSSFLLRRADLVGRIGLLDEVLPTSYGEDYDLLLRAARVGHILGKREPLVIIHWNRASFFSGKWQGIADGLSYLLDKHPEFAASAVGSARIEGQIAFALAALGQLAGARDWAFRAIRHDRSQLRAYAAIAIASRLVPAGALVNAVNRQGRGL